MAWVRIEIHEGEVRASVCRVCMKGLLRVCVCVCVCVCGGQVCVGAGVCV